MSRSPKSGLSESWLPASWWPEVGRRARTAWTPSLARRLWRHRVVRGLLGVALAAVAFATVAEERNALVSERAEWGTTVLVAEVTEFVRAGHDVAGSVHLVERPAAMVPPGAVTVDSAGSRPTVGRASVDLVAGELLLHRRILEPGSAGLPAGTVAITIEMLGEPALVDPGAIVDVWVADAANFSGRQVASGVLVLDVNESALSIAVPAGAVEPVVVASLRPLVVTRR